MCVFQLFCIVCVCDLSSLVDLLKLMTSKKLQMPIFQLKLSQLHVPIGLYHPTDCFITTQIQDFEPLKTVVSQICANRAHLRLLLDEPELALEDCTMALEAQLMPSMFQKSPMGCDSEVVEWEECMVECFMYTHYVHRCVKQRLRVFLSLEFPTSLHPKSTKSLRLIG